MDYFLCHHASSSYMAALALVFVSGYLQYIECARRSVHSAAVDYSTVDVPKNVLPWNGLARISVFFLRTCQAGNLKIRANLESGCKNRTSY